MKLILGDSLCGVVCECRCVSSVAGEKLNFLRSTISKAKSAGQVSLCGCCLKGRLRGLDLTKNVSENLYYGFMPPSTGILSGNEVNHTVKVTVVV